ncbi:MAG: serine hydrolase domain-containing protein [Gaiellaceae bacterium]
MTGSTMTDARTALPQTLQVIEQGMADRLHVGAQLYVSRRGTVLCDTALGEARAGVALQPDSLMLWMSSVKPVMGVAVAQLWERGLLAPDDPVCRHIPEFGTKGKEAITLRHVLTHTGGFRAAASQWSAAPWTEIIAEICDAEVESGWIPGRHAGYHVSSGWYILGEVVRRRDGRPFERYVREAIFEPLGMHDSWVGMPAERHRGYGDRIAAMHMTTGDGLTPHPFWPWAGTAEGCALCRPGGSAWGPIRELGRFYEALLAGGRNVLRPQTVEALTTRHTVGLLDRTFGVPLDRGLGVVVDSKHHGPGADWFGPHCSPRTFGHGGYVSSVGFADPEHGIAVALVFNGMTDQPRHDARVHATLGAIYNDLGFSASANGDDPQVFEGLDSTLRSQQRKD